MPPRLRPFALTAHVAASVGWLGAVVAYLALVVAALTERDERTVRGAWAAMEVIGRFVLVPLSLASLLTGLVQAFGTAWGLFRHYWVVVKLVLTAAATAVLLLHMPTVRSYAGFAATTDTPAVGGLPGELLHAGGGLVVLLATTVLSVFKPRGMTPYGWRKQREQRRAPVP